MASRTAHDAGGSAQKLDPGRRLRGVRGKSEGIARTWEDGGFCHALERHPQGRGAGNPRHSRQDDGGGRRDRFFRMNLLAFALLLAAGSRNVFDEVIEVPRAEWRYVELVGQKPKAVVNCE